MAVWGWHCTATLAMSFVGAVLDEPIRSSSLPGRHDRVPNGSQPFREPLDVPV